MFLFFLDSGKSFKNYGIFVDACDFVSLPQREIFFVLVFDCDQEIHVKIIPEENDARHRNSIKETLYFLIQIIFIFFRQGNIVLHAKILTAPFENIFLSALSIFKGVLSIYDKLNYHQYIFFSFLPNPETLLLQFFHKANLNVQLFIPACLKTEIIEKTKTKVILIFTAD